MSLLPSRGPSTRTAQEGEMQVVGVDEEVEPLLDALASETARTVLNSIYAEPGTPSEIASRLGMSIQKISYHLEKLEDQGLISVAGTRYSEKGQEMTVYEPPAEPLVLFVGTSERKNSLRTLIERLLPTVGILALASVLVQQFLGGGLFPTTASSGDAADAGASTSNLTLSASGVESGNSAVTQTPISTAVTPDNGAVGTATVEAVARTAGNTISPGVAFLLGGLLVLALLVGWWGYRSYAQNSF